MVRRLFVYGSLKRGGRHHAELAGARFLGVAKTAPRYALTRLGEYPALVPGTQALAGELFEVTGELLAALDAFEGPEYERIAIELEAPSEERWGRGPTDERSEDHECERVAVELQEPDSPQQSARGEALRFALAYAVRTR